MNTTPIYVVTTVRYALGAGDRAVGFFHELNEAKRILEENILDICEDGYYPYAVIESTQPGVYTYPRDEYWYQWNNDEGKYEPCKKPDRFEKIIGWGLG